ncbi:head-tail attachment protein [Nostoc phage Nsp-JY21]
MTAFAAATSQLFRDPNLSVAAVFYVGGADVPQAVRVIRRRPDEVASFGATRASVETMVIDARVADLPLITRGDVFVIAGESWKVSATPQRDRERLVWRVELNPVP